MAEGIMSLGENMDSSMAPSVPEVSPEEMQQFESAVREYAAEDPQRFGKDLIETIEKADPRLVAQLRAVLERVALPEEVIDALGKMIDALVSEPENYEENRQGFIDEGVPPDILPERFDPAFFAAMNIVLDELSEKMSQRPEIPSMNFAEGGLATLKPLAAAVAAQGRKQDTMLAHITPSEARLLRRNGGSGTINPITGLPEFFLKSIFKAVGNIFSGVAKAVTGLVKGVVNVVKSVASNPIGRAVLTVGATFLLGPAGPFGAGLAGSLGLAAMPNLALAVNTMAASTLVGMASGQKFGDALKTGLITGATAGIGAKVFGLTPTSYKEAAAAATAKTAGATGAAGGIETLSNAKTAGIEAGKEAVTLDTVPMKPSDVATGELSAAKDVFTPADVNAYTSPATAAAEPSFFSKAGDWVNQNIMPGGIKEAGMASAKEAYNTTLLETGSKSAAMEAFKAATPGILRTYGPITAAGLGAAYALGAFDTPEVEVPPEFKGMIDQRYAGKTGYQLLEEDPEKWAFKLGGADTAYITKDPYAYPNLSTDPNAYDLVTSGLTPNQMAAAPAVVAAASGGEINHFPRKTGPINGPGTGTSDSIPAMLSDGEFVFTAKAVRGAGEGSRRNGAKRMYALMKALEGNSNG